MVAAVRPETIRAATARPETGEYGTASVGESAAPRSPVVLMAGALGSVLHRAGAAVRHGLLLDLALDRPRAEVVFQVQVNLVLQDLLQDDGQLVAVADFYERTGAGVQRDHPLLDECGQFEPPADLI